MTYTDKDGLWHYIFLRLESGHSSGNSDGCGPEGCMRVSFQVGPDPVEDAIPSEVNRLQACQVIHQVGPGYVDSFLFELPLKVYLQAQGQETPHDVTDPGVVINAGVKVKQGDSHSHRDALILT